jgi:HAD superfamily hydrolase (TIGR01450 family)
MAARLRPAPVLCDLDGVVWLAHVPIAGSVAAIADLRAAGHRVVFVTNNSSPRRVEHEAALAAIGIPADGDVLTSAMAAARTLRRGERAVVLGGPGIVDELERSGVEVVSATAIDSGATVDAVVVGFHRDFDYEAMRRAATAIRAGARLIGTNDDVTYPTPEGLIPGGGAILAAVAAASGVTPIVAGKPHAAMAQVVRDEVGADIERGVMIGDRPSTDGGFAATVGCRFGLVLSGVTPDALGVDPAPHLVAADLAGLAAQLLADA